LQGYPRERKSKVRAGTFRATRPLISLRGLDHAGHERDRTAAIAQGLRQRQWLVAMLAHRCAPLVTVDFTVRAPAVAGVA